MLAKSQVLVDSVPAMNNFYIQGFTDKCASARIDPEALIKWSVDYGVDSAVSTGPQTSLPQDKLDNQGMPLVGSSVPPLIPASDEPVPMAKAGPTRGRFYKPPAPKKNLFILK